MKKGGAEKKDLLQACSTTLLVWAELKTRPLLQHLRTSTSPPLDLDHSFQQGATKTTNGCPSTRMTEELRTTFSWLVWQKKEKIEKTKKTKTKAKSKENEAFVCNKAAAVFSLEHWFGAGGLEETTATERVKVTECWWGVQSDSRPDVWTRSGRRLPTSSSCWQLGSFIIRTTLGRSVEAVRSLFKLLSSTQKPSRRNIDLLKNGKYVYWHGLPSLFWL